MICFLHRVYWFLFYFYWLCSYCFPDSYGLSMWAVFPTFQPFGRSCYPRLPHTSILFFPIYLPGFDSWQGLEGFYHSFQVRHSRCVDRITCIDKCSQTQLIIFVLLRGVSAYLVFRTTRFGSYIDHHQVVRSPILNQTILYTMSLSTRSPAHL